MEKIQTWKSPEEEKRIIEILKKVNPSYSDKLILLAVKFCCDHQTVTSENVQFEECVKERTKMLYFIDWREKHKNYL